MRVIQISAVVAAFAILLAVTLLPIQANGLAGKASLRAVAEAEALESH